MNLKIINDLAKWRPSDIAHVIRDNHPQIIAVILALLPEEVAAETVKHFTVRLRNEVVLRGVTTPDVRTVWVDVLAKGLKESMRRFGNPTVIPIDNRFHYITSMGSENYTSAMKNIAEYDTELAVAVSEALYPVHLLASVDDPEIQKLIEEVKDHVLLHTIGGNMGVSDALLDYAKQLRARLGATGPVKEVDGETEEYLRRLIKITSGVKCHESRLS